MISLAMIVRDEAARLPGCLQSVADAVDEIVVVDTGSSDGTERVARAHGARVWRWEWRDDFAAARNEALRHALGEWVLVLDADERLAAGHGAALRAAARDGVDGVDCRLVSALPPDQPSAVISAWYCRLFRRRAGVRFEGRVHEQIAPSIRAHGGTIVRSDIVIEHLGYAELCPAKLARNLSLLRRQLADGPGDAFTLFNLGLTLQAAGEWGSGQAVLEQALASTERPLARDLRAVAWTKLAESHLRDGRWAEAARACDHALTEEPDLSLARYALGRALFELGDIDRAGAVFDRLCQLSPDALGMTVHPRLIGLGRGLVRLRQRRWQEAVSVLGAIADSDPTGEATFQQGNAYLALGRLDEARRCYEAARAAGLASPHLDRRLALCHRLGPPVPAGDLEVAAQEA